MLNQLVPALGRLLAAGSPKAIKAVQAGIALANSPGCITLSDGGSLSSLFPRLEKLFDAEVDGSCVLEQTAEHELTEEEAQLAARAEQTREAALRLLHADDWTPVDDEHGDQLFVRRCDGRCVWKFTTLVDCHYEKMAAELIHNCDNCPSWNTSVKHCRSHRVAAGVEILHQRTGQLFGGLLSRREFVSVRQRGRRGQLHYSAVAAVEHAAFPQQHNYVRGENLPTVFTVRPCADAPQRRCVVEGTINCDLKLRLVPACLMERGMHGAWRQLREQMLQLAERLRASG